MIRPAFSTVACPTWTLDRVANAAAQWGYLGVEFRSFGQGGGQGGSQFASDPALSDGARVRALLDDAGVEIAGLATGITFDKLVFPPVIGHLLPGSEAGVAEGRHMVNVARDVGAPYVRVFAFQTHGRERRSTALNRICQRLAKMCDHARNRDTTVLIENGGSFPKASDLKDIIDLVRSPQLAACYDGLTASQAGEDVRAGCTLLGPSLRMARLRDSKADRPCRLGKGDAPTRELLLALRQSDTTWGTDPWAVVTWDRAWLPELSPAEDVLPEAARHIAEWSGATLGTRKRFAARQSAAPAMMV
jgi:sugar phosphate isomerase/epimerase